MSNQWLRLWHDMPNDPKWRTISRISKQPISMVIAVYVHLLVSASSNMKRGVTQCNTEDVTSALDAEEGAVQAIIDAMQGRVLDGQKLSGWAARQPLREDDSSERVREFRQRKKDVTQCNATQHNVTLDKDTDKDTDNIINTSKDVLCGSAENPRDPPQSEIKKSKNVLTGEAPPAFDGENDSLIPDRAIIQLSATKFDLPEEWGVYAENLGWRFEEIVAMATEFHAYWTVGKGANKRRTLKGWRQCWSNWISNAGNWKNK